LNETEGVIKFSLNYHRSPLPAAVIDSCAERLALLNAWRSILKQLGMIGQNSQRYGGLGFGNMSVRVEPENSRFVITGTQTGHLDYLQYQHVSLVKSANIELNTIAACGEIPPSSEALTHASIYHALPSAQVVIHIHDPLIWKLARQLNLPTISAKIAYGTPEMAAAVAKIVKSLPTDEPTVFAMLGHEDGVVAYGTAIDSVAQTIIAVYASALKLQANQSND